MKQLLVKITVLIMMLGTSVLYGQNLVTNGDLETWTNATTPTSWNKAESITQESSTIHGDTYSAKQQAGTKDLQQDVSGITAGTEYTISYWYFDNDANAKSRMWAYWLTGASTEGSNTAELRPSTYSSNNASWQEYSVTITAPVGVDGLRFEVRSYNDATGSGFIYYDDLSVTSSADSDPPAWTLTYPKAQAITAVGFDVAVNLDEIGTAYFVVLADAATAPSSAQVKAGTDASDGALASTSKGTISVDAPSTEYTGSASSLSASTAYDVYVVAEDDEGSPNLQASPTKIDVTTTVAASAPACTSNVAINVDHNSATLRAYVNPLNASTTVTFEYGLNTSYGSEVTADESPLTGSTSTAVSADVTGLSASTTYHFRVKAVNSEGTTYGSDLTFGTSVAPVDPGVGDLYISEIVGDDADGSNDDDGFIEIYNNTGSTLDLSDLSIRYYNTNPNAPSSTYSLSGTIPAGAYLTATHSNSAFNSEYGKDADFTSIGTGFYFNGGDDGVDLYHSTTGILDQFNDNGSGQSPWTWDDANVFERSSLGSGSVYTNWTEITSGTGSPGGANDNSLPVELSVFKSVYNNGMVKLYWLTDSEIENQGFIIERRSDTKDWGQLASFGKYPELLGQGSTTDQTEYTFTDKMVKVGETYEYRISDVDYQGDVTTHAAISVTVLAKDENTKPGKLVLNKAYPNPFNPNVTLSFNLEEAVNAVTLEVYDLNGTLVNTLSSGAHNAGIHTYSWQGTDGSGNMLSSGIYVVRLASAGHSQVQRITLLR